MPKTNPETKQRSKLLDRLQEESWQLELLISGFSIFLLLGAWTKLSALETDLILLEQASQNFSALEAFYDISRVALACLLGTLVFHVLLRGMWIAAIGLRSVSGDIEYAEMGLLPRFHTFLERRIGSFDGYIERLERNCSVLFTVAFLIFLGLLSLAMLISIFNGIAYLFAAILGDDYWNIINSVIGIAVLVVGLPYLLDFMTVGWLKRQKWFARPYYYLYRLMGWLTLARFSRPLYYNLIDNRFGKRLALALPALIFLAVTIRSYEHITHAYYPIQYQQGEDVVLAGIYDDDGFELNDRLWRPSLSSRYVQNNYLEFFIPYIPRNDDEELKFHYPDLAPARLTGPLFRGAFSIGEFASKEANNTELRQAMSSLWRISLDSVQLELTPRFSKHEQRRQYGLLYVIPAHELPVGEHGLRVQRRMHLSDTIRYQEGYSIYFYK